MSNLTYYRRVYRPDKAYYADALPGGRKPEVSFGYDAEADGHDEGTAGEFSIRWKALGGKLVPELRAFNDAWRVLGEQFCDLLAWLVSVDSANVTPEAVMEWAEANGCRDTTPYTDPRAADPSAKAPTCKLCGRELPDTGDLDAPPGVEP